MALRSTGQRYLQRCLELILNFLLNTVHGRPATSREGWLVVRGGYAAGTATCC